MIAVMMGTKIPNIHFSMKLIPRLVGATTELNVLMVIKHKVTKSPILPGTCSSLIQNEVNDKTENIKVGPK